MSSTQPSLLSVSCKDLDSIGQADKLATLWIAFNKSKNYIENGQRLENMSWRLWQYQRQPTNKIDNSTIKRFITSVLLSPAAVHDADSHEVAQEKCYDDEGNKELSCSSSIIIVDHKYQPATASLSPPQDNQTTTRNNIIITEDEEDEDYYLSDDDLYDEDDEEEEQLSDINTNFVRDFQKTQPRPTTPRRSLLSDLFSRVSSPPSLLSNSTSSFTSTNTNNSSMEDHQHAQQHSSFSKNHAALSILRENDSTPNETRWRESFHGW
ncbi:hypothetical protein A0J61_06925 [Choanephora cucurbitarum]|uniref:Nitrogen regulatory protein areA GATA-like domain-containing protein n=1 Tax=Choanephora cucurbitarum TaxID=101091 RepID=A0A1C7N7A8_9FUNG|nr:hypothetical protein A0J61_06925 [Choanephora cucurbitarum]